MLVPPGLQGGSLSQREHLVAVRRSTMCSDKAESSVRCTSMDDDSYMASVIDSILDLDLHHLTANDVKAIGVRAAAAAAIDVAREGAQPPTSAELHQFLATVNVVQSVE